MSALSEKIIRGQTAVLEEVIGRDTQGKALWAFVLVRADLLETFRAQLRQGCHLGDCGTLLASGSGLPPAHIRQALLREMGVEG
jgi:hypothetical protein